MDNKAWSSFFRARAQRPLPDVSPPPLPPSARAALAASLARFQHGEAGEGRIASEVRRLPVSPDYAEAVGLFVREEGRHARVLAAAVRALGGTLLRAHWSDRLFVHARRALGFDVKIGVLLAAEVVGGAYYGLVAPALGDSPLGHALADVAADEAAHLVFHAEYARAHPAVFPVAVAASIAGLAIVLVDHRAALRALGIGSRALMRALVKGLDDVRVVIAAQRPSERLRLRAA